MNFREITSGVFYAGVNDRTTERFESLWPLPYGVSYNAYAVEGSDAVALIDTVRIDEVNEYMRILGSLKSDPRYLVINHMEPDHSGSIPEVIRRFPNIKIVADAPAIKMVKGFYHIDDPDRFLEVKEGSEIDLGGLTLRFHITPMVHWPETMMTYVPERKLLFSGDAFGTFGALNGAILDTEMDTDWYFPEMERYYTNIVGKYGRFVQNALAKLSSLELDYICSTHGPVWKSRIREVVAIYDRYSKYESQKGVTIVYGSMYGNTAGMAEEIAVELSRLGIRNIKVHNAAKSQMSDMITDAFRYKGLIVGSATYSMGLFPPVETFLQAMETREIKGKAFGAFCGYTWAKDAAAKKIEAYAQRMNLPLLGTASMAQSIDANSSEQARDLAAKVAAEVLKD